MYSTALAMYSTVPAMYQYNPCNLRNPCNQCIQCNPRIEILSNKKFKYDPNGKLFEVCNALAFFKHINCKSTTYTGMEYADVYSKRVYLPNYDWRNLQGVTNPNFWQVQGNPFFLKNPLVKPSDAIQSFIQGITICDCGNAVQAFMYMQLLTDLGARKFDTVFGHLNLHFMITQLVMQPFPSHAPQIRDQAPSGNPLYVLTDSIDNCKLSDLQDGDFVYIGSTPNYPLKHLQGFYPGDNLVVVKSETDTEPRFIGFGSYFEHGPLTYTEIAHYLMEEYNKPQTPRIRELINTWHDNTSDKFKQSQAILARLLQDDELPLDPSSIQGLMFVTRFNKAKVAEFVDNMLAKNTWYDSDGVVESDGVVKSSSAVKSVLLTPIPSENSKSTFDNYITDGDPRREHLLDVFRRFVTASNASSEYPIALIVTGKAGVGKTHLSVAALNEIAKFGKKVVFINEVVLVSHYQMNGKFVNSSVIADADLIVFDDLNSEFGAASDFLEAAVRHVFMNNKSIIITSNNSDIVSKFSRSMPFHMAYDSPAIKNTLHIQVELPSFRVPWTISTSESGGGSKESGGGSKESKVRIFTELMAYSGNTSAGIIIRTKPTNFGRLKVYEVGTPYGSDGKIYDVYCDREPKPFTADVYVINLLSVENEYVEQFMHLVNRVYAHCKRVVVVVGPSVKSLKSIVAGMMDRLNYFTWKDKKMRILDRMKTMFPQLKF